MKTHYELLDVEPSADADEIKKAFRREIARYHPDKVVHLGPEFQEMAATRAAELTVAYKTLTDRTQRAEYDAGLTSAWPSSQRPAAASPASPAAAAPPPSPSPDAPPPDPGPAPPGDVSGRRFEPERAGRDAIIRRAVSERVHATVAALYGALRTLPVKGFDLALVPVAAPRLFATPLPRVLLKMVDVADAPAVQDAWSNALRAKVHAGKSPVFVLLAAKRIGPAGELARAVEVLQRQPRAAAGPAEVAVVVIDSTDWSARLPPSASSALRKLVDALRG